MPLTVEVAHSYELGSVLDLLRSMNLAEDGVAEHFGHFLVARDEESVIGACGIEVCAEYGFLRSLVVFPERRDEGVAGPLVARAEELARQMDLRALFVLAADAADDFRNLGYTVVPPNEAPEPIRESWTFRSGHCASSILLKKDV